VRNLPRGESDGEDGEHYADGRGADGGGFDGEGVADDEDAEGNMDDDPSLAFAEYSFGKIPRESPVRKMCIAIVLSP